MSVYLLHDVCDAHFAEIEGHLFAILCIYVLACTLDYILPSGEAHTELYSQACGLLAIPREHLGLNFHAIGARIRGYEREEQPRGFRSQREGIEGYADVGEESGDHVCGGSGRLGLSKSLSKCSFG
jgi:hypothetical protein